MENITVTLLENKQNIIKNNDNNLVIACEDNATTLQVSFPKIYEDYSKRINFENSKKEKSIISLYCPEYDTYSADFDKNNFSFLLPSSVCKKGELKIQFAAYKVAMPSKSKKKTKLSKNNSTSQSIIVYVPFELIIVTIEDSIDITNNALNPNDNNDDLILKSYQYSLKALEKSEQALDIIDNLTVSSETIDKEENPSVRIDTNTTTKHKDIHFSLPIPKKGTSLYMKGLWSETENYINNEYEIDCVNIFGSTYYCKKNNINQKPMEDIDSEYWGVLAKKGSNVAVDIADNLTTDSAVIVLSARQGKVLNNITDEIKEKLNANITKTNDILNNNVNIAKANGSVQLGNGTNNEANTLQFNNYLLCDANGNIPIQRLLDTIFPIGSIYISTKNINPGNLFGGTWSAYAKGRTIIGQGTSDREFQAGETGGESTHVLTIDEMAIHNHDVNIHNTSLSGSASEIIVRKDTLSSNGVFSHYDLGEYWDSNTGNSFQGRRIRLSFTGDHNHTAECDNVGNSIAHNNLSPYIVTYLWERIS